MHIRKKYISKYLEEMLSETGKDSSEPKNKILARALINLALDESQPAKLRLEALTVIMDRVEGKPLQTNLNAEVTENPFSDISTEKIEALRKKLEDAQK